MRLVRQYLYFYTSKARKLSTCPSPLASGNTLRAAILLPGSIGECLSNGTSEFSDKYVEFMSVTETPVAVGEAVGAAAEVCRVCLCACQMVSGLAAKSFKAAADTSPPS